MAAAIRVSVFFFDTSSCASPFFLPVRRWILARALGRGAICLHSTALRRESRVLRYTSTRQQHNPLVLRRPPSSFCKSVLLFEISCARCTLYTPLVHVNVRDAWATLGSCLGLKPPTLVVVCFALLLLLLLGLLVALHRKGMTSTRWFAAQLHWGLACGVCSSFADSPA